MTLASDLLAEVASTFTKTWDEQNTEVVPDPDDLTLNGNHAKCLDRATVLYADLDGSTNLVDSHHWSFSAEVYKTYLRCASQIIRDEGGSITAYDGDRVMAIFTDPMMATTALRAAFKINHAVIYIINPALRAFYKDSAFVVNHVVGVDTSTLRAARVGVRGENDIVWIGRAANYAAKLCALSGKAIWTTKAAHDIADSTVKLCNGVTVWQPFSWDVNRMTIYGASKDYRWSSL